MGGTALETNRIQNFRDRRCASSLLKKVFEVSLWATLIQDPSARRTKDSQPSGFGFEYCASHVRFRVFQQTARAVCARYAPGYSVTRVTFGRKSRLMSSGLSRMSLLRMSMISATFFFETSPFVSKKSIFRYIS